MLATEETSQRCVIWIYGRLGTIDFSSSKHFWGWLLVAALHIKITNTSVGLALA
jgi:hypothetical protein